MKKLLLLAPLLLVGCLGAPDVDERIEAEIKLSNGKSYTWSCKYRDPGCMAYDFQTARSIGSDTEYFCDLTGKFYIIKNQYRGSASFEQKGITCKFTLDRVKYTTFANGEKKVEHQYYVKD